MNPSAKGTPGTWGVPGDRNAQCIDVPQVAQVPQVLKVS